jgi:hypothetical protein
MNGQGDDNPAVVNLPAVHHAGAIGRHRNGVRKWFCAPVIRLAPMAESAGVALYVALDPAGPATSCLTKAVPSRVVPGARGSSRPSLCDVHAAPNRI